VAVLQFGIPVGTILAFFTTGLITDAFDSWRAPFLVAAVPGLILAVLLLRIDEPARGAADDVSVTVDPGTDDRGILGVWRTVFAAPTMRWLVVSGIGLQVAAYSLTTFLVPLLQRYYGLSLTVAGLHAGVVLGLASLLGLVVGGVISDRLSRRSAGHRVFLGGFTLLLAAPIAWLAFRIGPDHLTLFVATISLVSFLQFFFHTSALPAIADVNPPHLRSQATAMFFAGCYLFGGALGPIATGMISDALAVAGHGVSAEAYGLNQALLIMMPIALLLAGVGLVGAAAHRQPGPRPAGPRHRSVRA